MERLRVMFQRWGSGFGECAGQIGAPWLRKYLRTNRQDATSATEYTREDPSR
jgi:hypothetical protein